MAETQKFYFRRLDPLRDEEFVEGGQVCNALDIVESKLIRSWDETGALVNVQRTNIEHDFRVQIKYTKPVGFQILSQEKGSTYFEAYFCLEKLGRFREYSIPLCKIFVVSVTGTFMEFQLIPLAPREDTVRIPAEFSIVNQKGLIIVSSEKMIGPPVGPTKLLADAVI